MLLTGFIISIVSFSLTVISVPFVNRLGKKFSLIDKPNERKQHDQPIVRVGGVAIYVGIFSSILLAFLVGLLDSNAFEAISPILISSSLIFLIGFIDDIYSISFLKRLIFQILVSTFAWKAGIRFDEFDIRFIQTELIEIKLPASLGFLFTNIWTVGIINAFNWLDGLDGLATGITFFTSLAFMCLAFNTSVGAPIFLMFALSGACLGFLFYNYNPAKIFMGDGGSYLIGSLIAFFSIYLSNFDIQNSNDSLNLVSIFLILFVPLADMTYDVFSRIAKGKLPFLPDRQHLHHRLLRLGFSPKDTVILCYLICIFFCCISLGNSYPKLSVYFYSLTVLIDFYFLYIHKEKLIKIAKRFFKA